MAKWINFPVVGGVTNGAGTALDTALDGDNLLLADTITSVKAEISAGGGTDSGAMIVTMTLSTGGGPTSATVVVATNSSTVVGPPATSPDANVPSSTNYVNKLKEAVNKAITANPGGVKSTCSLPQDTASATAAYDPTKKVYFRSFRTA